MNGKLLVPTILVTCVCCFSGANVVATDGDKDKSLSNPQAEHSSDAQLVEQLIVLLDKTDDSEVAMVTIRTLGGMGVVAKVSVPTIIRNAGRLGLLQPSYYVRPDNFGQPAVSARPIVLRAISSIMGDDAAPIKATKEKNRKP